MRGGKNYAGLLLPLLLIALGFGLLLSRSAFGAAARVIVKVTLFALLALAALVAVIVIFALTGAKKKDGEKAPSAAAAQTEPRRAENEKLLAQGRSELAGYRARSARIRNAQVRDACAPVFAAAERLLQALREQPEEIPGGRSFFNYYLPTLGTILKKYEYLERSRALHDGMEVQVCDCLAQIRTAEERLYESLFEDEVIDLTAEMQTLTAVGRKDGLLDGGTVDAGERIRLRL